MSRCSSTSWSTDRSATGAYHFRPFGRPQIECYFGGRLAAELERGDAPAFVDFAIAELTGLFGGDFARRHFFQDTEHQHFPICVRQGSQGVPYSVPPFPTVQAGTRAG
jgi:hypothetical protein